MSEETIIEEVEAPEAVEVENHVEESTPEHPPAIAKGLDFWSSDWRSVVPDDGQWRELAMFRHCAGMTAAEARGDDLDGFEVYRSIRFDEAFGLRVESDGTAAPKRGGVILEADWSRPTIAKIAGGLTRIDRVDRCQYRVLAAGEDFVEWQEKRTTEAGASYRVRRWEREGLRVVDNVGAPLVRRGRPDVAWAEKGVVLWARDPSRPGRGLVEVDIEDEIENRVDARILKRSDEQRYTLGVVYYALRKDAHGDQMTPEQLEKSAWGYTIKSRRVGMMHANGTDGSGEVVESYIYRGPDWTVGEQVVKAGDWLMGVVWSKTTWSAIKAGKLTGYSLQGMASRVPD